MQKKDDMFDLLMSKFGFAHKDHYSNSDFGSVEKAIDIFGFIYGLKVINYLQK